GLTDPLAHEDFTRCTGEIGRQIRLRRRFDGAAIHPALARDPLPQLFAFEREPFPVGVELGPNLAIEIGCVAQRDPAARNDLWIETRDVEALHRDCVRSAADELGNRDDTAVATMQLPEWRSTIKLERELGLLRR